MSRAVPCVRIQTDEEQKVRRGDGRLPSYVLSLLAEKSNKYVVYVINKLLIQQSQLKTYLPLKKNKLERLGGALGFPVEAMSRQRVFPNNLSIPTHLPYTVHACVCVSCLRSRG